MYDLPFTCRYSWASAIERWLGSVCKDDIVVLDKGRNYFKESEVVILSYDLLARRAQEMKDHNFKVVILVGILMLCMNGCNVPYFVQGELCDRN